MRAMSYATGFLRMSWLLGVSSSTIQASGDSIVTSIAKLLVPWQNSPSHPTATAMGIGEPANSYENITRDPGVIGTFYESQVYIAQIDDPFFPTSIFTSLSPNDPVRYRLKRCAREDVGKCLFRGNSTNGLPKVLQGIWFQDGIGFMEEVISSAGPWDPVSRQLDIPAGGERNWGSHDTSSRRHPSGLFWLPSGAAHMNWLISWVGIVHIVMNEELTFGQCYATATLFKYFPIYVPAFLFNWTMTLEPDGSWLRKTETLGIPTPSGDYTLRNIITGEGEKGPYFDKWLKFRDGRPFIYAEKI